jgi:hypothetical protein
VRDRLQLLHHVSIVDIRVEPLRDLGTWLNLSIRFTMVIRVERRWR